MTAIKKIYRLDPRPRKFWMPVGLRLDPILGSIFGEFSHESVLIDQHLLNRPSADLWWRQQQLPLWNGVGPPGHFSLDTALYNGHSVLVLEQTVDERPGLHDALTSLFFLTPNFCDKDKMQPMLGWSSKAELVAGAAAGMPSPMVQVEPNGCTSYKPWNTSLQLPFAGRQLDGSSCTVGVCVWPVAALVSGGVLIAAANPQTRGCFNGWACPISHAMNGNVGSAILYSREGAFDGVQVD